MISRAKKYVAVLLVFVCVCMIFSPQTAYAAEDSSQHETVKVGFFAMDGYHVMDEEGNRISSADGPLLGCRLRICRI